MRHNAPSLCATGLLALFAGACGNTADLGQDDVTSIPAGDASGTDFSGLYAIEVRTVACTGSCSAESEWFTVSVCDIGDTTTEWVQITQKDGVLEASWEDPLSLLRGGISADSSFDMGGFGTQNGGELEISLRVTGRIGETELSAQARSWTIGDIDDGSVDCVGQYEVSAPRPSGEPAPAGPSCSSDADCSGGNCNDELGQCQAPGPSGYACSADDDCSGGNCNNELGQCQAPGPSGYACSADDDCSGGNCNNELGQCQAPGPSGYACSADDDCSGGNCNNESSQCG